MAFTLIVTEKGGTPKRLEFDKDEVTIGRVPGNDVILPKGNVSKRHSRVVRQDGRFFVVDLKSTNGTYLNGRRITTPSVIRPGDKIYVGDFVVVVEMGDEAGVPASPPMDEVEPIEADAGFAPPPDEMRASSRASAEPSLVEPLPLDQEPPESAPPPPMAAPPTAAAPPVRPPPIGIAPPGATAGGPRPNVLGQTLASGGAPVPPIAPPSAPMSPPLGVPPVGSKPTQPPPRLGARPPGTASTAQLPRVGNAAPPVARPPTIGGSPLGAPPPAGSPSRMLGREPGAAPPPEAPPMEPIRRASSQQVGFAPIGGPAIEPPSSVETDDDHSTGVPMVSQGAHSAPSVPSGGGPMLAPPVAPPPVQAHAPQPATMNIPPATVDAVIASHRAASQGAEPLPAGREYAILLGEVIAEARSAGAVPPADRMADAAARAKVRAAVEASVRRRDALPANITVERLVRDASAELAGAGAIEVALEEPEVTTVIVEAGGRVIVGRGDAVGPSSYWFSSDAAVLSAIDRLLHANGLSRPANNPIVEATLADGSRLLAVLPPAAPAGPTVVLERPAPRAATLIDLAARGMLNSAAATLIGHAINARRNIIVSGPRGSGRSTLLTALVAGVPAGERVVAVEDRREVGRFRPDVTMLEPRGEWRRAIDIALRLRPHRVALGEANEATTLAFVGNLSTGAEGWFLAVEGASPVLALVRAATLVTASGAMSKEDAIARIAATRPLVIHLARLGDGTCRVVSIGEARAAEIGGLHVEEAFSLRIEGVGAGGKIEATLAGTGVVPSFAEAL